MQHAGVVAEIDRAVYAEYRRRFDRAVGLVFPSGKMRLAVDTDQPALGSEDSLENIPAYAAEVALLRRTVGDPGADALTAPFALGDRDLLASMAERAGLSSATVTTQKGTGRFPDIRSMVEPDLIGWLPVISGFSPFGVLATSSLPSLTASQAQPEPNWVMPA